MLREIIIKNLATIEEEAIAFEEGLNVITGETGAGKSVILKAIELILGNKGSSELIRSGKDSLEVQALFDLSNLNDSELANLSDDFDTSELVIKRTINSSSKNKIQINGNLATQQQLAKIGPSLLSICSQGQNLNLLDKNYHLEIIDFFAKNNDLLGQYQVVFKEWKLLQTKLEQSSQLWQEAEMQREDLLEEITKLKNLGLHQHLREELTKKIDSFKDQEFIFQTKQDFEQLVSSDVGLLEILRKLGVSIRNLSRQNLSIGRLEELHLQISELSRDLEKEIESLVYDDSSEEDLESLENRLADLARLQRKYHTDDAGLIKILNSKEDKLRDLNNLVSPDEIRLEFNTKTKELEQLLKKLTSNRRSVLPKFEQELVSILKELNLPNAKIQVQMEDFGEPRISGREGVEFLISLNPGEECRPLRKVASGGEMSRILLALKSLFQGSRSGCCFIFDEIDTGISGATARIVGEKLRSIAKGAQVLCITHLPQVASLANHHLKVEKVVEDRTYTTVSTLNSEQRIDEVARLLSGREVSKLARASAVELIEGAI